MLRSIASIDFKYHYILYQKIRAIFIFLLRHSFLLFLSIIYLCIVHNNIIVMFNNCYMDGSICIVAGIILAAELYYLTKGIRDLFLKCVVSILLLIIVGCETDELIKLLILVYILLIGCFILRYNNKSFIKITILLLGCFENTYILNPMDNSIFKRIIIISLLGYFIIGKEKWDKKYSIIFMLYFILVAIISVEASACFLLYAFIDASVQNVKIKNIKEVAHNIYNNLYIMLFGMIIVSICEQIRHISVAAVMYGYDVTQYYMDYIHFGFGQRGLIGTVVYYLFGYYISLKKMCFINIIGTFISLSVIILILFGLNELKAKRESTRLILCTAWLVSPAMRLYYSGIGSFDVYMIMIVLICVYCICSNIKHQWIIPILCIIGVMIHPAFIFTCFPSLFIIMTMQMILDYNSQIVRWKQSLVYAVTCIAVVAFSVYFLFVSSNMLIGDYGRAKAIVNERIGYDDSFDYNLFRNVLFTKTSSHLRHFMTNHIYFESIKLIWFLVRIFPVLLFMFLITKTVSNHISGNIIKKIFQYLPMTIFIIIPLYYLELDDGRWSAFIIDMAFIVILGLDISQEKHGLQIRSRWEHYDIWCYVILISQYMLGDIGRFL